MFKPLIQFFAKRKADKAKAVVDAYASVVAPMATAHVPVLVSLYRDSAHKLIDTAANHPELIQRAMQVADDLRDVFKPVLEEIYDDFLDASDSLEASLDQHAPLIKRLAAAIEAFSAD